MKMMAYANARNAGYRYSDVQINQLTQYIDNHPKIDFVGIERLMQGYYQPIKSAGNVSAIVREARIIALCAVAEVLDYL